VARKIDRKQLKSPDQFVSFWTHAGAFVAARKQVVLGTVLALLVGGLGTWGLATWLTRRAAQASQVFSRIERIASADLLPATGEAPKGSPDDGLPHFKTEQERLEAALKEADAFLSSHSGSRLRGEAQLLRAKFLLGLGKAGDAVTTYQTLLGGSLDGRLRFLAGEGLGYALEAAGQDDKAIAAFGALAEEAQQSGGFYRDRALYSKARLLEKKGSGKEAGKLFKEILDRSPTTPLREEINDRLAALEGK
jgi:hypothetical protein